MASSRAAPAHALQQTLDEAGTPLSEVTFLVVDLETTGASPATASITEIGAVRVRGGQVEAELSTLVRPPHAVPAAISALTGITDAMVATAPPVSAVLPSLLELAHGAVVVAHNARFDLSFLRGAAAASGSEWPRSPVLDTLSLARAVLPRPAVANHKLSTLAAHLGSSVTPTHRALDDARATVDVLHALLALVGNQGVTTLEEVLVHGSTVPQAVRTKRHLARGLPRGPGVYLFRGPGDEVLHVGSSVDLRARVRSYFTAGERRSRMAEMVRVASGVDVVETATELEARVRELRLIAEHEPRYNRRSRRPGSAPWLKLTDEPYPRLSVVRARRDDGAEPLVTSSGTAGSGAVYLGPFSRAADAHAAAAALHEAVPLRRCTPRLPARAAEHASACVLADIGRCSAPCTGGVDVTGYAPVADRAAAAMSGDPSDVVVAATARMARLGDEERFEEATAVREQLTAFLQGARRAQRVGALVDVGELVAARPEPGGGWELVCVRRGRLVGTAIAADGTDPRPVVDALVLSAEAVDAARPGAPAAATAQESEVVLRWLEGEGVRLVRTERPWASPLRAAASEHAVAAVLRRSRR